jgi:hypothetical protein
MLSSGVNLKWTQEGKSIHLICDNDAGLPFAKEALFQFQMYLGRIEEQARAQAQAKAEEEAAKLADKTPEEPKPIEA